MDEDGIRASDLERDAVAERLRVAYAEGRLNSAEFADRLDAVLCARTRGELGEHTRDLPLPPPRPLAPGLPARRLDPGLPVTRDRQPSLREQWYGFASVNMICLLIWAGVALTAGVGYFWPVWVLVPWGIGLTVRTAAHQRDGSTGAS